MPSSTTLNESLRSPIDGTEFIRLATPGNNWKAPLSSLIATLARTKLLLSTTTYNVTASGSDVTGDGSVAKPWLTPQHAANFIGSNVDISGQFVNVSIGAGTFAGIDLPCFCGGGFVWFTGAGSANTTIGDSATLNGCINVANPQAGTFIGVDAVKLNITAAITAINADNPGVMFLGSSTFSGGDIVFGGSSINKVAISPNSNGMSFITINGCAISISGTWGQAVGVADLATYADGGNWTLVGTPVFTQFVECTNGGIFFNGGVTYTGAASGQRFLVDSNAQISGVSGNLSFFPGSSAGTVKNGGIYL